MCSFKLALCQMLVSYDKSINVERAVSMIEEAKAKGAIIAILPEMFTCPYDIKLFSEYSETQENSQTLKILSKVAKDNNIYICAGSIPEKENDKIFNTSYLIGNDGAILSKHRKVHLFDIDIKDKISFTESDVLSSGDKITYANTEFGIVGSAICYDIRFPELFRKMAIKGVQMTLIPGAFNMVTGPLHWELLARTRAVDNQMFVVACSPARDEKSKYVAYGHSLVADPFGRIIAKATEKEEVLIAEIDLDIVKEAKEAIPVLKHLRNDVY